MMDIADRVSGDATFNLFNWYREFEGGLWLEETQEAYPWIVYDSDEDFYSEDKDS